MFRTEFRSLAEFERATPRILRPLRARWIDFLIERSYRKES